ncbi:MAG: pitrilysin family protein [Clostridia bacterium]
MVFFDKLDNGVSIVTECMPSFRSVSMGVWIGAGSIYEDANTRGASHFIEHMLFKGTQRRTARDIAAQMDAIGGNLNAFTAKECTCFYAKVLDEHMEKAADMLADILCFSKFDEDDMRREKGVVCEEILMMEDSPEDLVHEKLCESIYTGTPLSLPILGTEKSVSAFTRDDLMGYMDAHYVSGNIVIACAGNFNMDNLRAILAQSFGSIKSGKPQAAPKSAIRSGIDFKAINKDTEQTHICMGLPGYATDSDGQYALCVLNNALGGSMSSRLFQKIREERGLAYSVYSYPSSYADSGYFTLYAGTGEAQTQKVCELMLDEVRSIKRDGITQDELIRSKEQLKGSFMLGQESTSARANAIGKSYLAHGKIYSEEEIMQRIERVSMDDIMGIVPYVFDFSRMAVTLVGRNKDTESIKTMVTEG